jgi:formylglycine-generating enzyme required for sulfatase activity
MKRCAPLFVLGLFFVLGEASAEDAAAPFRGRIVYEQSAEGESEGAKAFRGLAASKVTVTFSDQGHRQEEVGGMNEGVVILQTGKRGALFLDPRKRTSERGGGMDLDEDAEEMQAYLPWHYKTDLEATDETDTICGYPVRKYRVKQSGFVKKDAVAHIWIAETLSLPRRRYQFEFETRRIISAIPLSIPIEKGAILKVHIVDAGVPVTIVATEVVAETPEASLFVKPENYEGPDFLAPPTPVVAAKKTPLSAEEMAKLAPTITNGAGMKLVLVKPGTFQMGSPEDERHRQDDETQHEVTLTRPYYIGIHEVTQAQWKAVMGEDSPSNFKGDDLPVEKVTWAEANAFCARLSEQEKHTYRLPTEAEWAFAARAGEAPVFKTTKEHKDWLAAHAWMYGTAKYKTHPVGSLKPNAWGLYDTIGNVGEWTSDGFAPFTAAAQTDPLGVDGDRKVVRGNGWISSFDFCRMAQRSPQPADQAKSTIGLRVVREP